MTTIDLNADLGENSPGQVISDDAAMLDIVSSANISCGFHAGYPYGIRDTMAAAVERGITIGAHPGYHDPGSFGRREIEIDPAVLQAQVEYQLGAVMALAVAVGGSVAYVKPHGALYNRIAVDEIQAQAVISAIRAVAPELMFLGLAGGIATERAAIAGLATASEAFADRAYRADGQLVPRSEPGAVLHDAEEVADRMLRLVQDGVVPAIDGTEARVAAGSICVHGDSDGAVAMAATIRARLESAGVEIAPFAPSAR